MSVISERHAQKYAFISRKRTLRKIVRSLRFKLAFQLIVFLPFFFFLGAAVAVVLFVLSLFFMFFWSAVEYEEESRKTMFALSLLRDPRTAGAARGLISESRAETSHQPT